MAPWEVSSISISTVTEGHVKNSLFANGRMQVPVTVFINAKKKGSTERYHLSDQDLKLVKLIDFNDDKELTGGWTYSTAKNEYAHVASSMPIYSSTENIPVAQNAVSDTKPDIIQFWVSTTEVENKEIGASITPPDGPKSSTNKDNNCSSVILTGKVPITYTTDDIVIQPEEIYKGNYKLEWTDQLGLVWYESWPNYWQTNHYVSLKGEMPLKRVDIHDFNESGYEKDPEAEGLANSFAYWASDNHNMRIYYIWEYGPETTKEVGLKRDTWIWNAGVQVRRIAHANKDITVNQKANALCMTIMYYSCEDALWGKQWYYDNCGFVIYDIYGNTGKFKVTFQLDKIIVQNSQAGGP